MEGEVDRHRRSATRDGLTPSGWPRQKQRRAVSAEPSGSIDGKLAAIRAAARHDFPTGDIDRMLHEIESGYRA